MGIRIASSFGRTDLALFPAIGLRFGSTIGVEHEQGSHRFAVIALRTLTLAMGLAILAGLCLTLVLRSKCRRRQCKSACVKLADCGRWPAYWRRGLRVDIRREASLACRREGEMAIVSL